MLLRCRLSVYVPASACVIDGTTWHHYLLGDSLTSNSRRAVTNRPPHLAGTPRLARTT